LAYVLSTNLPSVGRQRSVVSLRRRYEEMRVLFAQLGAQNEVDWLDRRLSTQQAANANANQTTTTSLSGQKRDNSQVASIVNDDFKVPVIAEMSGRAKRALKRRILSSYRDTM
jgi:hypothetical protein